MSLTKLLPVPAFLYLLLVPGLSAQTEAVLIRAPKPYTKLVRAIESNGGRVVYQYQNFDGIAAEIHRSRFDAIATIAGPGNLSKDLIAPEPGPVNTLGRRKPASSGEENRVFFDSARAISGAELSRIAIAQPSAYLLNSSIAGASALHASGITGNGVVVAVIDSGIRPGFPHLESDGSVIGCVDFVGDALGCTNSSNNPHGTFVAGMISANVVFTVSAASAFRNAVLAECPGCFVNPPANTQIPMLGTAPLSSIYAFRVFGATGGSPDSRTLAAMDAVIGLRKKFDAGDPAGVNIRVCNMSLGGATLTPVGGLESLAVKSMIDADIVPVIAAGNAGPASLTVGEPGAALAALTVGAASLPHNERIYERLAYPNGALYRPFPGVQTAYFSSRGPNADGHGDPDVSANGFDSFGQGYGSTNSLSFGSGTSFATPTVAGVAALLRQAVPGATARQVRNAIIASADPSIFADGSGVLDRGAGYVAAAAARDLLLAGHVPDTVPTVKPNANVNVNIQQNTTLRVLDGFVRQTVAGLKPGQRNDILYRVAPNTKQVVVALSNVTPALPPEGQNQLFGDDILLAVHSAKTSSIGEGDYPVFEFTTGGTFTIDDPEPGILRVSVNGDWTNAGSVSANVAILSVTTAVPELTTQGKVVQGQIVAMQLTVPPGTANAEFRLSWREDWGSYPLNDLDLILISPSGAINYDAATINSPERATIAHPQAGVWTIVVDAYEINTGDDRYELRIALDGKVVH